MSLKSAVQSKKPRLNKLKTEAIEEVKEDVMRRLNVNIPARKLKAFKIKASQNDREMSELVNQWVDEYLSI
jgi:ferric iron reductase protein FhuF